MTKNNFWTCSDCGIVNSLTEYCIYCKPASYEDRSTAIGNMLINIQKTTAGWEAQEGFNFYEMTSTFSSIVDAMKLINEFLEEIVAEKRT